MNVLAHHAPIGPNGLIVCLSLRPAGVIPVVHAIQVKSASKSRRERGRRKEESGFDSIHDLDPERQMLPHFLRWLPVTEGFIHWLRCNHFRSLCLNASNALFSQMFISSLLGAVAPPRSRSMRQAILLSSVPLCVLCGSEFLRGHSSHSLDA